MLARENEHPTPCVIKTSKNVTARLKLPMWNFEDYGLSMPTDKANLYEWSLSNHNPVWALSQFRRKLMLNRPGAVLYSGTPSGLYATFIENIDAVADLLQVEKVRYTLYTCSNTLSENLLGRNAIIGNPSMSLEKLHMAGTALMGNAYVARTSLANCVIGGYSTIIGGEHSVLSTTGKVALRNVNTHDTHLSGNTLIVSESDKEILSHYYLAADGTLNSNPAGEEEVTEEPDREWRHAVYYASSVSTRNLLTFCLNNALHETRGTSTCKCGYVLPLALAGHPVAISYLLNRAGLTEYIPTEYAGMTEKQMLARLSGARVLPRKGALAISTSSDTTYTSIRNLEDWKNLIRAEYGLEEVQSLYKYHENP